MALVNLTNNLFSKALPFDAGLAFGINQTLAANGIVGNQNQIVDIGIGNTLLALVIDLKALKVSAGTETVQFHLLGSNDPAFTAGNVELLAFHDFAAAAASRVNALLGPSPVVPVPNESIRRHILPFWNVMGGYMLRYLQLQAVIGGGGSVTCTAWVTDRETFC